VGGVFRLRCEGNVPEPVQGCGSVATEDAAGVLGDGDRGCCEGGCTSCVAELAYADERSEAQCWEQVGLACRWWETRDVEGCSVG
jgi:hypothetical protein